MNGKQFITKSFENGIEVREEGMYESYGFVVYKNNEFVSIHSSLEAAEKFVEKVLEAERIFEKYWRKSVYGQVPSVVALYKTKNSEPSFGVQFHLQNSELFQRHDLAYGDFAAYTIWYQVS